MSARQAVLGLVIERPGYGYQLAQRMGDRFGAWRWEPTGVYRALDTLAREGDVHPIAEKGSGDTGRAAPRLIYEATPQGVEHFRAWMMAPSSPSPARQELDLKLLFSEIEFIPDLLAQIRSNEQRCINDLGALTSVSGIAAHDSSITLRSIVVRLQADAEVLSLEARIKWLRNAHATLSQAMAKAITPSSPNPGA
jgi:DNA-binding PadR family transcriptional regulator